MTIEELSAKIEQSDKQIAELTQINSEFEKENLSLTAKVTELEKIGGEQNEKIATLESDAKQASEKHAAELAKLNADIDGLKGELSESKKQTAELREQNARFGTPAPKESTIKQEEKPATAGLSGLAKAIAAHKAEQKAA